MSEQRTEKTTEKEPTTEKPKLKCPVCNSDEFVKPIVYGYPGPEVFKESKEGKVILGGCCVSEKNPVARCTKCGQDIHENKDCIIF